MLTGIRGHVAKGHTCFDHLIDTEDEDAVTAAVAGKKFRRSVDALNAARRAFAETCDYRVMRAKVWVEVRTAFGDVVAVGR